MNHSPYAPTMDRHDFTDARTSILAILAVVFAVVCFIPGTGVIAILLGIAALGVIAKSNGRIEGRGAALSGIILGLITTVIWGAISFGMLQGWTYYTKQMVGTGDRFFQAAAAGDFVAARAEMTTPAAEELQDAQLEWFINAISERSGDVVGASTTARTMLESFGEVFSQAGGSGKPAPNMQVQAGPNDVVVPIAVQCASGSVIAWLVFDEGSLNTGGATTPKISDLFMLFGNGDVIALRHDGPAAAAAAQTGMLPPGGVQSAPVTPTPPDATDAPAPAATNATEDSPSPPME